MQERGDSEGTEEEVPVHTARKPREGWAEAFKDMAESGDDHLIDEPTPTAWEDKEWEW